jgi:hypothetical protein
MRQAQGTDEAALLDAIEELAARTQELGPNPVKGKSV